MKIELLGWETRGLRCPDAQVDLRIDEQAAQIALVQMPNGTGKTTTLQMLTATLTGAASHWSPEFIRSMRRPGDNRSRGSFKVDLQTDRMPVTFELELDFDEGRAVYRTTTPATGGVLPKWAPPPGLRRFVTQEFIRLFVFDGEFAERLLKADTYEAERAIEALCELYLLDEVEGVANEDWERAIRNAGPTTTKGLSRTQGEREKIRSRIKEIEQTREHTADRLDFVAGELNRVERKIQEHVSEHTGIREQHEQALEEKADADRRLDRMLYETLQELRAPNALHAAMDSELVGLKAALDQLKLPEATTRQFFVELANADECVCGRPLDDETRRAIEERADQYMGEDEAGAINALKEDIDRYCGNDRPSALREKANGLAEAMDRVKNAEQDVRALKHRLIDRGDDTLKQLETQYADLGREREELVDIMREIDREPESNESLETTYCLKALRAELDKVNDKISRITNTLGHRRRVEVLTSIVDRAKNIARESIKGKVRDECNSSLEKILRNDPVYIEEIAGNLKIRNQRGASVGQSLAIGYAFLLNLLNRGTNNFPLVVDSPCGSLDDGRREIIGSIIPELATQFVTFVIPTERAHFVEALESSAKAKIVYITLFRRGEEGELNYPDLPDEGVSETESGVLVHGREYFQKFRT